MHQFVTPPLLIAGNKYCGHSIKAIDDTGAGDMFAGGFMHGLVRGLNVQESAKIACYLAGRVVSQYGARISGDLKELLLKSQIL